jgi:predicted transposase YbfD/YdcC
MTPFGGCSVCWSRRRWRGAIQLWLTNIQFLQAGEVVAIDGKHLRRSHDQWSGQPALQVVNAWASQSRLMLGQVKVEEGSNEITAVPRLLEQLMLTGCIVTLDAMGSQTEIAAQIIAGGADYILSVKDNQPALAERVRDLFAFAEANHIYAEMVAKRHGRIETRRCWVITQTNFIESLPPRTEWNSLGAIVRLSATRRIGESASTIDRFFITSLTDDASILLNAIRAHWQVENTLHCTLDVVFRENDSRHVLALPCKTLLPYVVLPSSDSLNCTPSAVSPSDANALLGIPISFFLFLPLNSLHAFVLHALAQPLDKLLACDRIIDYCDLYHTRFARRFILPMSVRWT